MEQTTQRARKPRPFQPIGSIDALLLRARIALDGQYRAFKAHPSTYPHGLRKMEFVYAHVYAAVHSTISASPYITPQALLDDYNREQGNFFALARAIEEAL